MQKTIIFAIGLVLGALLGMIGLEAARHSEKPARAGTEKTDAARVKDAGVASIDPRHVELMSMSWDQGMVYAIMNHIAEPMFIEPLAKKFAMDADWRAKTVEVSRKANGLGPFSNVVLERVIREGEKNPAGMAEDATSFLSDNQALEPLLNTAITPMLDHMQVATFFEFCKRLAQKYPSSKSIDYLIGRWTQWGGDQWLPRGREMLAGARSKALPQGAASRLEPIVEPADLSGMVVLEAKLGKLPDTLKRQELEQDGTWTGVRTSWDRAQRFYKTRKAARDIVMPRPDMSPSELSAIQRQINATLD